MYGLRRAGCYLFIQTTFGISHINGKRTFTSVCSGEREACGRDQAPIICLQCCTGPPAAAAAQIAGFAPLAFHPLFARGLYFFAPFYHILACALSCVIEAEAPLVVCMYFVCCILRAARAQVSTACCLTSSHNP